MSYQTFNEWMSKKDIFGFNKKTETEVTVDDDKPFQPLKCERVIQELLKHNVGLKNPTLDFPDQITWGNKSYGEALRIDFTPMGSLRLITRRFIQDLEGNDTWICKHVLLLPDEHRFKEESEIAGAVLDELTKIDKTGVDSAAREYDLEKLTLKLIGEIRMEKPCKWMMLDNTRKVNNEHYIISMNMTGSGRGSSSGSGMSGKIEKYQIHLFFDKDRGLIRSFGNNIQSQGSHHWIPSSPDWDEYFSPSQTKHEIIECIIRSLKSY